MTLIYPSPIYGPVHSRRLGLSLGVNLMPPDGKICTFDCIYCECGFNADFRPHSQRPTADEVASALELALGDMHSRGEHPDVITFAGNGEPTAHPDFERIISDTVRLRDRYCAVAKVSVLSNATMLHRQDVCRALMMVDNNIQKLDTVNPRYISMIDRPQQKSYDVGRVISQLRAFNGHVTVQTMFMHGEFEGQPVDNVADEFLSPWLDAVRQISPRDVMIYTVARETPARNLSKATHEELDSIALRVREAGFPCTASY